MECGNSLNLLRKGAKYCTGACKIRAYRRRRNNRDAIPAAMRDSNRWMRWKLEERNGRDSKRPVMVDGRPASSTNPGTWTSFESAKGSATGSGVGFALGNGVGCIDLDDAIVDGRVADWAQRIIDACPPTFIEVSQSGRGLHIFGLIPEMPGRNTGRGVEVYSTGRFIAMTGDRFKRSPAVLADLSDVVSRIV